MRKPAASRTAAIKPRLSSDATDSAPEKLVCAGLALAVITLALRIMSLW